VLRIAGDPETAQEYIQHWLELDEGDPTLQLLTEEDIAVLMFVYLFLSSLPVLLRFPFIYFLSFCLLWISFASLIRITPPHNQP
jgi:hypothetical protein